MTDGPERHPQIPADAVWVEEVAKWEVVGRSGTGIKEGESRLYRPDGTLYMRSRYVAGLQEGGFEAYHPDGRIAREGHYENGLLVGSLLAHAPEGEDGEPLRSCCVPPNAYQLRAEYERDELLFQRFFDRQGRLLLSDGSVCPAPPPGLPASATFDEGERRWAVSPAPEDGEPLWRFYREDGSLQEEARFDEGVKLLCRLHAPDGELEQETHFDRNGRRHGSHRRRFIDGEMSPYLDARIFEERGELEDDEPVGRWTFLDREGVVVRTVERGRPLPADGPAHPVFADQQRPPRDWNEQAAALAAGGQTAQAICAAARAAAGQHAAEDLVSFIARHTVALRPSEAVALAEKALAVEVEPARALLSALVSGGDPAMLFRSLASVQRESPRAGCDFVEAALLLEPDRPMTYLTRALLRLELGEEQAALADAARLQLVSEESARFVRDYARVLLPVWGFWPHREKLAEAPLEGFPEAPQQPIEAIRRTVQLYATRLSRLRAAVVDRHPGHPPPRWAPPDLGALLPAGPLELRRYSAEITDEIDDGTETVTVEIDETLDPEGAGLPALMRAARSQWAALSWLCWSCGLARVELPERLEAPSGFAAAAAAAIARFFRGQDVLSTGGLRSRTAGVPGFSWEAMEIDEMPKPFVALAVEEYFELRALFLWLLSPENLSPFQSDLRDVG
jgi:hypothetical protein